jgi:hypothetical protein
MKQIFLHIGMHKTGTTSIQNSLHDVDGNVIRTVRFKEKNHSIPIYTIFSEKRYDYPIWKVKGLSTEEIDNKKDEYLRILSQELSINSSSKLIISGEDMSILSEVEQEDLCRFLKSKDFSVKVIYITRDPVAWAVSMNQQRAKGGAKKLSKINPEYRRRLQGFINGFGIENIYVYKYEDLIKKGLINSFSEIFGVKLEDKGHLNESMSTEALTLQYIFNNIEFSEKATNLSLIARNAVGEAIRNFFSVKNGFQKLKLEGFDLVDAAVEEDLIWLKEYFSITYSYPTSFTTELSDLNAIPDPKNLSSFFEKNSHKYNDTLSLNENFENLFNDFLIKLQDLREAKQHIP